MLKRQAVTSVDHFDEFWASFPRKVAKSAARTEWERRGITEAIWQQIQDALAWQRAQWTDPRYVPHASTYLHQERWTDEPLAGNGIYSKVKQDRRQDVSETCSHQPKCLNHNQCDLTTALGRKSWLER